MRTLKTTVAALGLAALLASPAWAQRGGGFMGGPAALLSNKSVQQELKLDDKQVEEANKVSEDLRAKAREAFESAQGLEGAERQKKMQEVRKQQAEELNKTLSTLLKPEQRKRFDQISLQQMGAFAFGSHELQSELKLTDAQKDKIKEISDASREQMREIFQNAQGDRRAAREKMVTLRKETLDKVVAELNDDQKKTWKEKTGAPFEVRFEPRPNQ